MRALDPVAAGAAAQNGVAIDTLGYNSGTFVVHNGVATGVPTSYTVDGKVQESADGSTGWADVVGAAITQIAANSIAKVIRVEGLGTSRKRYLRVVVTPAFVGGTSPAALVSAIANLGNAFRQPVVNAS